MYYKHLHVDAVSKSIKQRIIKCFVIKIKIYRIENKQQE